MYKMSQVIKMLLAFAVAIGSTNLYAAIEKNEGLLHQDLVLYNGKKGDPYTMFYPFEVTKPGRVNIEVKVNNYKPERFRDANRPVRMMLVDSRFFSAEKKPMNQSQFQKIVNDINKYNPAEYIAGDQIRGITRALKKTLDGLMGKKRKPKPLPGYIHVYSNTVRFASTPDNQVTVGRRHYDIDAVELSLTQGMYFVVLENVSRSLAPEIELKVDFPGEQYAVADNLMPPRDLGIRMIRLSGDKVHVQVRNNGEGRLSDDLYERRGKDAFALNIKVNGKHWGGVTLKGLDPDRVLKTPGSRVGYTFDKLKIDKTTEITATLTMPKFKDANRKNNSKSVTFEVDKPSAQMPMMQVR
ncbi:hypothetical protein [Thiomicrorhabdus sp. 6S3-12]|uniref:hypothetical protein n=1 Tax=Thiomicrorhabdus sp. 6S3-12 TaxID=2819681 RepID=UPI001AAD99F8|nr:hypothetical protein [Thiomicrorhabdus sp. 6S3-12]MBO1924377.1 hypothetical protein [Thiomicrorhabdus sp. 6S3-12]